MSKDKITEKAIKNSADGIAQEYGIKGKKRVQKILALTDSSVCKDSLVKTSTDISEYEKMEMTLKIMSSLLPRKPQLFLPDFREALCYLAPETAMELFENIELSTIFRRLLVFKYLTDLNTPLYTFRELTEILKEFVCHLKRNREYIIKTGVPKVNFNKAKWLDNQLGYLYCVKFPVWMEGNNTSMRQSQAETNELIKREIDEKLECSYSWASVSPPLGIPFEPLKIPIEFDLLIDLAILLLKFDYNWEQSNKLTLNDYPVELCNYEDGAYIKSLGLELITKLDGNREKLLDNRIRILDLSIECMQYFGNPKGFLEKSIKIISEEFTRDEIEFFNGIDFDCIILRIPKYLSYLDKSTTSTKSWGGFTQLLDFIFHLEKESEIGTFHKTKSAILGVSSDVFMLGSYYQIIGRPYQNEIEKILDDFFTMLEKEDYFNAEFQGRMGRALDGELDVNVIFTPISAKPEHADGLKDRVDDFTQYQLYHLKVTGEFATGKQYLQALRTQKVPESISEEQQKDYETFEYLCYDAIAIPGKTPKDRSNILVVNDLDLGTPDNLFCLFLRLTVELKKGKGGWVYKYDLYDEGIFPKPENTQKISNLRTLLKGSLLGRDGFKFIECGGSGRYRISTHPDFITYDRDKLLIHKDPDIKRYAEELPKIEK